jgi:hypothetical protein
MGSKVYDQSSLESKSLFPWEGQMEIISIWASFFPPSHNQESSNQAKRGKTYSTPTSKKKTSIKYLSEI